jgi:hypothetical protein
LRAWVLAQLLWNPHQDERALINEFLEGYYGPTPRRTCAVTSTDARSSKGHNLTCYSQRRAASSFQAARRSRDNLAAGRSRSGEQPGSWNGSGRSSCRPLRLALALDATAQRSRRLGATWPLPESRQQAAEDWLAAAKAWPGKPWTKITLLNEGGLTPEKWASRFK